MASTSSTTSEPNVMRLYFRSLGMARRLLRSVPRAKCGLVAPGTRVDRRVAYRRTGEEGDRVRPHEGKAATADARHRNRATGLVKDPGVIGPHGSATLRYLEGWLQAPGRADCVSPAERPRCRSD